MVEEKQNTKSKEAAEKADKKSRKGLVAALIAVAAAAVIGVIVAIFCLGGQTDPSDPTARLDYSDSFFIYDNNNYMLWNKDGKRLTEDDYTNQSNFVGGYAMVKKDDQYGIIRDDGTMAVDFGKYGSIINKSGLYLAQDGNTKEYYLLTGSGKELAKGNDLTVYAANATSGFAAAKVNDKIRIYNHAGKLVAETGVIEDADDPILSGSHDFGLFHYGDQNILLDARNGEVLAGFEGPRHTFDTISDSRKLILLENYDNDGEYKLIANGKLYDLDEVKYYGITALDGVVGYDNYSELAILDDDYKVAKRVSTYIDLKDANNYAVENENGNAEIYHNGEKIKEFGDESGIAASGIMYEDLYAIEDGDKYMFYNLDGSVGINHEFKDIYTLFDKFHHAVVSDEDDVYYLIDAKGNQIGDVKAKAISSRDGGYELKNSDGKYAIAGKDGKPVTDFKYNSVYYRSNAEPRNIWTGRSGSDSFDVIDVDSGNIILEDVDVDGFYTNYFVVKNDDGKTEYYTYAGELFYTSEK